MFVVSKFLVALADILSMVLTIFYWLILVRVLISWVSPDPHNPIVQFLYKVTEPILYRIRKMLPINFRIGIDISPLIAFLAIVFLRSFLVSTLLDLASRIG
ncbi:MAG: YggT family protein [Candidatus Omnitrophica bacterium]|nr:YggT family protein [Candidatus Omnitrophota bacterium]MBU0878193.1 YggT family protein [Candidatus Omnitrophota bacterium]MBU0897441.1 YggT family protein [Candidatus Omnitrophota bacterium]MBU1133433.1 YggT family protein [Candidatus Omnitrophota bacterium]MBU1809708.1 YggT family protein [Candidatus Omnitrophota bacterium]